MKSSVIVVAASVIVTSFVVSCNYSKKHPAVPSNNAATENRSMNLTRSAEQSRLESFLGNWALECSYISLLPKRKALFSRAIVTISKAKPDGIYFSLIPCGEESSVNIYLRYEIESKSYVLIMDTQPYSGYLWVFPGENRRRLKLAYSEDSGFSMEEKNGKFSKKISIRQEGIGLHTWNLFWAVDNEESHDLSLRFTRKE